MMLICSIASFRGNDEVGDSADAGEDVYEDYRNEIHPITSIENLDEMIAYLRHDDTRLVRYNVPR